MHVDSDDAEDFNDDGTCVKNTCQYNESKEAQLCGICSACESVHYGIANTL